MKQVDSRIFRLILTLLFGVFLSVGAYAQSINVKGHVKDAMGEVIGANVVEKSNPGNGTITDVNGNFSLKVKQGATLVVSFVGYITQEVKAAPNVTITLEDDSELLEEAVVIGYGVAKKSDLTGSVIAMKPDLKNKGVVINPQDMMVGKIAGVNVTSSDGTPGGGNQIRIRGGSSLNASNDPLIVIDGVAMDNNGIKGVANPLSLINPQDIESFNVLKDASSTAIYGSRGSNGVIIITTKKGSKGQKPQVSYAGSLTVSTKKNSIDVMDANEYRAFIKDIWGEESDAYRALGTANTDWQDEIMRTAISHDYNVTLSGSFKNLPYRASVGYTDQQGIIKTSEFQRVTASLNLNPTFFDEHLTMNLNAKGMYSRSQYADGEAISDAIVFDPTQDPYDYTSDFHNAMFNKYDEEHGYPMGTTMAATWENMGHYFEWPMAGAYNDNTWPYTYNNLAQKNPLAILNEKHNVAHSRAFIGSADVDYKVHGFEDLRLHMTLGADISKGRQQTNTTPASPQAIYYGSYGADEILKRNLSLNAYAQYYKDFNKNHHFDIMGGYEWQHFWRSQNNDYVGYYPTTNNDASLAGTERPHTPYKFKTENYLVSFFGRANYILNNRYYLTGTIRYDGSSRFSDHWSLFPSAAFAWKVKEEAFLKDAEWLSDLKLRLGYGQTGQQDVNNDYAWVPTYSMSTGTNGFYPLLGNGELYRPDNYTPDLKWETTTTYNVGLDFGFLNQRLTGSVDVYYRETTDLLNYAPTVSMSAFRNQAWQNIGSLENKGVELTLDWKAIQTKDWFWTLSYNVTYNQNEITDLSGVSTDGEPVANTGITIGTDKYLQYNQVGQPINSFYVYQQVYDQNGKAIENCVVDRNGDGQITEGDRYFYKSPAAPVTMGLTSRLEYKNWDFGFSLRASFDNYVFNNIESGYANLNKNEIWASTQFLTNRPTWTVADNWQTYSPTALLSDRYVHNASFLKCDNITLGYSFQNLFKAGSYKGLAGRVYATASNVFTLTNYDGLDPEISNGYDNELYPRPFSFIVGLNLNL